MKKPIVGLALRERLGEDATHDFHDYIEDSGEHWRSDVITTCNERMDVRLERFASREDLIRGFAEVRQDMAALRVELLRWSFAFWLGQVVAMGALMTLFVKALER